MIPFDMLNSDQTKGARQGDSLCKRCKLHLSVTKEPGVMMWMGHFDCTILHVIG